MNRKWPFESNSWLTVQGCMLGWTNYLGILDRTGLENHYRQTEERACCWATSRAPVVGPGTMLFCCSIVVFLVVTVLMFLFRILLPFPSPTILFVFLCAFYFWLISVCVHEHLLRKLWLLSLSWGKLKAKRGQGGNYRLHVWSPKEDTHRHSRLSHTLCLRFCCPSVKMSCSLSCL